MLAILINICKRWYNLKTLEINETIPRNNLGIPEGH